MSFSSLLNGSLSSSGYSYSDSDSDFSTETAHAEPWEKNGGFVIYLVVMFYVFYGFEIICDEFLVPALNLFCEKLGMADDFAGATLMGLGCCAPDVFSGIFGVLVLKTDVGAGTVVGSLLFNHLAILGGICLAVQPFKIKLSSFIREVTFYAISLALLLWSLWDHKVTIFESTLLLITYVIFCIVCGFTPRITRSLEHLRWKLTKKKKAKGTSSSSSSSSHGSYKVLDESGADTKDHKDLTTDNSTEDIQLEEEKETEKKSIISEDDSYEEDDVDYDTPDGNTSGNASSDTSAGEYGTLSIKIDEAGNSISGYLYKKSKWHSKAKVHRLKWKRKWYTISNGVFFSCKDPLFPTENRHEIPLEDVRSIDFDETSSRIFVVRTAGSKKYTFRAQSKEDASEWARHIREAVAAVDARRENGGAGITPAVTPTESEDDSAKKSYWDMPEDKLWRKVMWVLAVPYYAVFTVTIPNVKKKRFENWFIVSFIICLGWIAALSYGMVWCGERFALVVGIPEDIMGLTIGAIGASLPSFFGSVIAAREGSYQMAVSNTFGANLSSILVALGLPCFIQTAMVTPGKAFPMESESIVITVLVLVVGLIIFLISIGITKMWLNKPLGVLYFALYVILLGIVVVFQITGIHF